MRDQAILVVNAGSSSIKFTLFKAMPPAGEEQRLCDGQISAAGTGTRWRASGPDGTALADQLLPDAATLSSALPQVLAWIEQRYPASQLLAAGHRVVHGGSRYSAPTMIDTAVLAELRRLIPLAPLHQPQALAAIDALRHSHPGLCQIACFDTAFHHNQPALVTSFALPQTWYDEGVRRYGFHGLSYEYIAGVLPALLGPQRAGARIVVAHLGAGASMCALHGGRSIATTMGFSTLDGLPMSRRCGSIDPGAILYLLQEKGLSAAELSDLLYQHSGLMGLSGISDDMRTLLHSAAPQAAFAIDLYVYRVGRELGSLAAALGGLDALVFTAGIGEHAPLIRARIGKAAAWLGVQIDAAANEAGHTRLSPPDSAVSAWMIPTDEDVMIVCHCRQLLNLSPGSPATRSRHEII